MNTNANELVFRNLLDIICDDMLMSRNTSSTTRMPKSSTKEVVPENLKQNLRKVSLTECRVLPEIERIIFDEPATIVMFADGTKSVVKCCKDDTFDKEAGIVYACIKRLFSNTVKGEIKNNSYHHVIEKLCKKAIDQKSVRAAQKQEKNAKKAKRKARRATNTKERTS